MKKILITGKNSKVAIAVNNWLSQWPEKYDINMISLRDGTWKTHDLSKYDVIFHVAGIAHVTLDPSMEDLFYRVNRDLTIEVADKAKAAGIRQFIFMSSGIVYGDSSDVGKNLLITKNTLPNPTNFYGMSKLQAEKGLKKLEDDTFKVVIIRSPALYGIGMKSHYNNLSRYAKKYHFFPNVSNCRSMLYNKNLAEFVRLLIENEESGIFCPQNKEYTSTKGIICDIARIHNRKIKLIPIPRIVMQIGAVLFPSVRKAFGNFVYEKKMSEYRIDYRLYSYEESLMEIETCNEELIIEKLM